MVSPLLKLLKVLEHDERVGKLSNPTHERANAKNGSSGAPNDDDLARLERSLVWLKRECMIAALEAGTRAQHHRRRLPLATALDPVSGIPPVNIYTLDARSPEHPRHDREGRRVQVAGRHFG
jgi:hypothetical protein